MITTPNTQQRIIKAMANGAKLVFHACREGYGDDGYITTRKVTLERNGHVLLLSTFYREDEYHFVPCEVDGKGWLRHGEHSCPQSGKDVARLVIKQFDEVRNTYEYRGDFYLTWREIWEHRNQSVPLWVSEQWEIDQS